MSAPTQEQRIFRMMPDEDLGFAKPALKFRDADGGEHVRKAWKFSAPEPELARDANDPGYWTITLWLPVGAEPLALVPDPDGPAL